eukprot:comp21290_c1_seq1/m.29071 comp21290_c1_seq1/g.29071  ORF comp21290_c1_seq1/g.29071 comp21290_c1_seq1/m.29071 type:complete len:253 (-) comp21290_c1_seq1:57-815(-)
MSLEDPFFVVKDEVEQAVSSAKKLFVRWQELYDNPKTFSNEEYEWTSNELRNSVRSIEWDLEDLDDTINIVEQNPAKFKITPHEMNERKAFIAQTRQTIKEIREAVNSQQAKAKVESQNRSALLKGKGKGRGQHGKYEKLDQELQNDNQTFIEERRRDHRLEMEEQDANLERVGRSVGVLKELGNEIGRELEEHNVMLDELGDQMEQTDTQLNKVIKKVDKILDNISDRKQLMGIGILLAILIVLVIIYTVL